MPWLALKLSVEFDEDAVLLLVTTNMASETKVGSTQCIADVTALPLGDVVEFACLRMRRSSAAWLNSDM